MSNPATDIPSLGAYAVATRPAEGDSDPYESPRPDWVMFGAGVSLALFMVAFLLFVCGVAR